MAREYMIYAVAIAIGFLIYLVLDHGLGVGFAVAMLAGFVAIHGMILVGRRFF
ncbi:MAG: hypothetical protein LCH38_04305 [Proteobacteria bacterium]|nr:hypothetical protein [Pseudomonadota bacterium]